MSHYTLGAHQARVSQQYISYLLLVNHIITPHYRNLLCPLQILNDYLVEPRQDQVQDQTHVDTTE